MDYIIGIKMIELGIDLILHMSVPFNVVMQNHFVFYVNGF